MVNDGMTGSRGTHVFGQSVERECGHFCGPEEIWRRIWGFTSTSIQYYPLNTMHLRAQYYYEFIQNRVDLNGIEYTEEDKEYIIHQTPA